MSIPKWYLVSHSPRQTKVCKLNKSIYGLKQASRQWYSKLSDLLISLGYVHSNADHSLFTKLYGYDFIILLVYLDDIVLSGNNHT